MKNDFDNDVKIATAAVNAATMKGDTNMDNQKIEMLKDVIEDNHEQQSVNCFDDVFTVGLIKQKFNDGVYWVGSMDAIYSDNDYRYRAPGKGTETWTQVDGTFVDRVKAIFTIVTEKTNLFKNEGKQTKLLFVTEASVAIKCFMAFKALKNGEDYIAPLVTFKGERQEALVEAATEMMKAIIDYRTTFKLSVHFDNYDDYREEVLAVTEEAKKYLKDGMLLHFNGKICANVPGVSFKSNWHNQSFDRKLKIVYKSSYNKNNNTEGDDNEESEKTPLKYVVERTRNNNGGLTARRGAFMTKLWSMLLKELPKPQLSEEEAMKVFDFFRKKK